jgi:hypothetical protein
MSMDVWSVDAEVTTDAGDTNVLTLLVLSLGAGAGAMVIGWPGSGCGSVSYTHIAFLERTQLLQGVSLLHLILRRLHSVHELLGGQS